MPRVLVRKRATGGPPPVAPPVNTVAPAVTGTATVGQVLSTTDGTWTGTAPITFGYQWQRGGVDIGGATANTYTLVTADEGSTVRCVVTGTNAGGSAAANSNSTSAVAGPPVNTVAPAVTGTTLVGSTLTTTNGTWTGYPAPTFTYQWQRAGVNIGGATSSTYVLVTADLGSAIRCVVTGTNTSGAASANSNSTAAVTGTYAQEVLFDSPVAYWKLNEASGTTAADSAGSNTGTYHGGAIVLGVAGPVAGNTAVRFVAASTCYVAVPDAAALDLGDGPFTIEFWFKATGSISAEYLMDKDANAYSIIVDTSATTMQLLKNGIGVIYTLTDAAIGDTTGWHYFVMTKTGATCTAYIDGVSATLGGFANQTLADTATLLGIAISTSGNFPLNHSLGQIAFYKSVLTPTRVSAHYAARNT